MEWMEKSGVMVCVAGTIKDKGIYGALVPAVW